MTKAKLKVEGMHCASCAMLIDGDLEDLAGVKKANTSYHKGETEVEYDEQKLNVEKLAKVVENTGYRVKSTN